jgi:hypothetical protein
MPLETIHFFAVQRFPVAAHATWKRARCRAGLTAISCSRPPVAYRDAKGSPYFTRIIIFKTRQLAGSIRTFPAATHKTADRTPKSKTCA